MISTTDPARNLGEHYADIYAELSTTGLLVPQNDMAVAATCRALECGVLVGPKDEEDFSRVAGLRVHTIFGTRNW